MKCQDFAQIVVELAREQMMDAEQRSQGLAHAASCASCATRLADERSLTAGLQALAASDVKLTASAATEAALLTAFRQKAAPVIITAQPVPSSRWPRWAWAAAAAILLALSFVALRARPEQVTRDDVVTLPSPSPTSAPLIEQQSLPSAQSALEDNAPAPRLTKGTLQVSSRRHSNQPKSRPQPFLINDAMTVYASDNEVMSDFVSLTYGKATTPLESGQLIRVQMPRAALAAYGLPVNLERADTPVKADLLVSEDGQAHAIRFVR